MKALLIGEPKHDLARIGRVLEGHGWHVGTIDWLNDDDVPATFVDVLVIGVMRVDRRLPALLKRLRERGNRAAILVLGPLSIDERTRALESGADEFLQREIPGSVLLNRILALLRLRSESFQATYQLGELTVDVLHRRASRCGRELALSQREFQLLALLAQHAGHTLSRGDIIERLWGLAQTADDNTLDAHVSRLRRKLDAPFPRKLIHTVRGVGYRLSTGHTTLV